MLPEGLKKIENFNELPYIIRDYSVTANYCDVICIAANESYNIPGGKSNYTTWHMVYNIITGKKLQLQDIFKKQYNWKKVIVDYIKEEALKSGMQLDNTEIEAKLVKADFWFDNEHVWINIKPEFTIQDERKNSNVFSMTFEYLGEENLSVRE